MREAKAKSFAEDILKDAREKPANDTERQLGVQANTLRVRYSNGRRVEGFAWSHYQKYQWVEENGLERLTLLFDGPTVVTIEGHRLQNLLREIDDGRRRVLTEMSDTEAKLALATPDETQPVITSITAEPSFEDVIKELKGDENDASKGRFTERLR